MALLIVLAEGAQGPSQWVVALALALPLLVPGAILAFVVARFSAWYARRWRGRGDE